MTRRIIYIRNPSEGSHFRTIGGGGGTSPRTPRKPRKPRGTPWKPSPGTIELTGGAIYETPESQWFVNRWEYGEPDPRVKPYFGQLPDYGVSFDTTLDTYEFQPAKTIWGSLYYIMMGIDPNTGDMLAPIGTPGTLKPVVPGFGDLMYEEMDTGRAGGLNLPFYGGTGDLPSGYTGKAPPMSFPALIQFIETHQDIPDFSVGGLSFSFNPP